MTKRLIDIAVSALALVLFAPLFAAMALWVKLDSPGPVFYRGRRAGRGGIPFDMIKFRSMVTNADRVGGPSTAGDDPRVTPSGKFIRRFKLDELSQLINVLRGDMSLVGPRPEVVHKTNEYTTSERRVLMIRPGITDWASLWNCNEGGVLAGAVDADAAYEAVIRPHKMKLQQYYVANRSLWSDFRIVFFTLVRIVRPSVTPQEIDAYPSQAQLRADVKRFVQQTTRSANEAA